MTAYNIVAELTDVDPDSVADELLDEFAGYGAAIARSLLGRTELILTLDDAPDLTAAIGQALTLLDARQLVSLHVLPTSDFDRTDGLTALPALMSVTDAATTLGKTRTRIQQMIDEGTLPARKVGNTWVILAAGVDNLRDDS
ncbi:helix-turn-helix domain-containing protein [Nocardia puris]|uniref:helix-turn-helix domain-containing protein n=1 Tax=Nocardia puris TaxID=208602 RepID=UPI0018955C7C|nr:helix-turn-helix domain-containing protein [Nocardia puris]MBF6215648.1 helix-turn-helix domain-containing protein [Nocardia puris]